MPKETLNEALKCKLCHQTVTVVHEAMALPGGYASGECFLIECPRVDCKRKKWCYCNTCEKRFDRANENTHCNGKKHKELHAKKYPVIQNTDNETKIDYSDDFQASYDDCTSGAPAAAEVDSVAAMETDELVETIEQELRTMETDQDSSADTKCDVCESGFPKMNVVGNEWLIDAAKHMNVATPEEIHEVFAHDSIQHMKHFWMAEAGCGPGLAGGGLCFLVGKAFQHQSDSRVHKGSLPEFAEAYWQLNNMLQYHSMNDDQRRRQARLNLQSKSPTDGDSFFKRTYVPNYAQLSSHYGANGKHSMYANLPTPKILSVGGVAYAEPRAIIAYALANAVPFDDLLILAPHPWGSKVVNVDDCRKARQWLTKVKADYYSSENGAPKHPNAIGLVICNWKDGFCYNNCKSNRSLDLMTMNVGAPKDMINGTENTFPVAIGVKKAPGWSQLEHIFSSQMKQMETTTQPQLFFSGATYKVQPVFVKRFAFIADRPARADLSYTLSYSGDTHKRFAVSGKVVTPKYDARSVKACLEQERKGSVENNRSYSWTDRFITSEEANGAKLPSCKDCRKKRLRALGTIPPNETAPTNCSACADWDMVGDGVLLDFPQHKDYPKHYTEGSPIPAPVGRDVFQPGWNLPFIRVSFELMVQACKFAFFQASRNKKSWTKLATNCYLTHCGVSPKVSTSLYNTAEVCRKNNKQHLIRYDFPTFCGVIDGSVEEMYYFPASWSDNLLLTDFIETPMHQLALGIAKSNFELATKFLSDLPGVRTSGLSSTGLRRSMQALLVDLKPIRSNWNNPLPFNVNDQKGYTTGGWVGDQWFTFIRFSKMLFGWCVVNYEMSSKYGVDDLNRMVICFHCLVARCMSHGGVDSKHVAETELYVKEFLSCVRDLDVRTRYTEMNLTNELAATADNDLNHETPAEDNPSKEPVSESQGNTDEAYEVAASSRQKKKKKKKKKKRNTGSQHKKSEAFWEKSNYMSLLNLLSVMLELGPLVLWWDGGGKGERYIQKVKPLIKRGVRADLVDFCVRLLDKLYRIHQMELLGQRYKNAGDSDWDDVDDLPDVVNEVADVINQLDEIADLIEEEENEEEENEEEHYGSTGDQEDDDVAPSLVSEAEAQEEDQGRLQFSTLEEQGMSKTRTIHVYRNLEALNHAVSGLKPLAGIVEVSVDLLTGKTAFEFQMVHRKPVKQFARRRVTFGDSNGLHFNGMWCSQIQVDPCFESYEATNKFRDIQDKASFSAIAVPLKYVFGDHHEHSDKYYVTTNWWKERMCDGSYRLPCLDSALYSEPGGASEMDKDLAEATTTSNSGSSNNNINNNAKGMI